MVWQAMGVAVHKTNEIMVKIFTTITCSYCLVLKEFLKKHNIEFEEVDVSEEGEGRREMVEKSGQLGVPVTEINGQIVISFDKEKISEILNIKE